MLYYISCLKVDDLRQTGTSTAIEPSLFRLHGAEFEIHVQLTAESCDDALLRHPSSICMIDRMLSRSFAKLTKILTLPTRDHSAYCPSQTQFAIIHCVSIRMIRICAMLLQRNLVFRHNFRVYLASIDDRLVLRLYTCELLDNLLIRSSGRVQQDCNVNMQFCAPRHIHTETVSGGGRHISRMNVAFPELRDYIYGSSTDTSAYTDNSRFNYLTTVHSHEVSAFMAAVTSECLPVVFPIQKAIMYMPSYEITRVAVMHHIPVKGSRVSKQSNRDIVDNHKCTDTCPSFVYIFRRLADLPGPKRMKTSVEKSHRTSSRSGKISAVSRELYTGIGANIEAQIPVDKAPVIRKTPHEVYADIVNDRNSRACNTTTVFPPKTLSLAEQARIIRAFCDDLSAANIEEAGCSVCGQLTLCKDLRPVSEAGDLSPLINFGVKRIERLSADDPIEFSEEPILTNGNGICKTCLTSLNKGMTPKASLANHLWLGDVPEVLKELTFAEQLLISKIRHNRCLVRVASGRGKMIGNAIMFASPVVKVYHTLPPPRSDINEVLAFVFVGSIFPTEDDLKRSPMLVRREKVSNALECLKLNHSDYEDLNISKKNLATYPLCGVPVTIDFRKVDEQVDPTNKEPAEMSKHEMDEDIEQGTSQGPCPFVVRGLTGTEYAKMSIKALKARALEHLEGKGKVLGVGHDPKPQSMYDNPQAYPQMFPWLFPYGSGGIGQVYHFKHMSDREQKRRLLMYHDKRFQRDFYFPMIAFNHEQMKANVTGSFLFARRKDFEDVSARLYNLNTDVVAQIAEKMSNGENVKPETDEEKACFALLDDIDHVSAYVDGFLSSKKAMRNEIWSLVAAKGAPNWFITFAPADSRHPLCLYYAGSSIKWDSNVLPARVRNKLIAENPVAASRFFDVLVRLVIKHVFGFDSDLPGVYGRPSAYYGTVEQQGRLTLHMHMMLWISGAFSPQQIRDRLISEDSEFTKALISYLEGAHTGDFLTGSLQDIEKMVPKVYTTEQEEEEQDNMYSSYNDPTLTVPDPPATEPCDDPDSCSDDCVNCTIHTEWWIQFKRTVDDLIFRSNRHTCRTPTNSRKGCLDKDGICRSRFPREVVPETIVDLGDGHITMRKLEPMINTITPLLTYLLRCNTDVTCMMSGTTLKAVIKYVTDYITKVTLKSHHVFSTTYDIYQKNADLLSSEDSDVDPARKLLVKICNSLTAKMEIGSPLACLYLLGNPDHYTSHRFKPFVWRRYVNYIQAFWSKEEEIGVGENNILTSQSEEILECHLNERVLINVNRNNGEVVARDSVDDYRFRPLEYENVTLYDWVRYSTRRCISKKRKRGENDIDSIDGLSADDSGNESDTPYNANGYLRFRPEHPQYDTHEVRCSFEIKDVPIPNWIGGTVPRRDQGDREFYCMTMLCLFKPWRDGAYLKAKGELWDEAFSAYEFGPYYTKIMENLNLKYECLDAQDDYFAQLKKKGNNAQFPLPFMGGDNIAGDLDEYTDDYVKKVTLNVDDEGNILDGYEVGNIRDARLRDMGEATTMISRTGWLETLGYPRSKEPGFEEHPVFERIYNDTSATKWKSIVKEQRSQALAQKLKHAPAADTSDITRFYRNPIGNDVRIVDASYLTKEFKASKKEAMIVIDDTVEKFSLNKEQERAFRIVANHAASPETGPLRMYLGGMGGTGKSQVIKALIYMFEKRNEKHRFTVLAPTGTAAALLNGSTYHSMLGIRSSKEAGDDVASHNEIVGITEARERMRGIDYIFIDEISMVACHELYMISARLAEITNVGELPFGGLSVILAGDFAQLPPTGGSSLYRPISARDGFVEPRTHAQKTALGKFIWHQVNTVVILKQNMRQKNSKS